MPFYQYIPKWSAAAWLVSAALARAETLEQLTTEALRNNPELQVLEHRIAAAQGGVITAQTYANPELTLAPGFRETRDTGATRSEFHGELAFSQLFKFPGKRALEIAIAQRGVRATELALEAFRFQMAAKVRRAFYNMLGAQRMLAVRDEQVESAKAFAESARKRVASGYAGDFEIVKSQADLIEANKALLDARSRLVAARIALNTLLGRSPSAPVKVTGRLDAVVPTGDTAGFVALAMARNPALRAQELAAETARLSLRATRFGKQPDLAVGPAIEYTRNEQTYGLSGTLALPLWDQKKGEIQTATAEQQRALAELEKLRAEVRAEVTKSADALRAASARLALYSPSFLDKIKAFVQQAEKSYSQNATTLIIYLDAKRTYFDTLGSYYETLARVAEARGDLESAVGVPLEPKP